MPVPPMTSSDVMGLVALLMGCTVAMWHLPGCGHDSCLAAHRAEQAKEHDAFLVRLHETHDPQYPTKGCPHCQ